MPARKCAGDMTCAGVSDPGGLVVLVVLLFGDLPYRSTRGRFWWGVTGVAWLGAGADPADGGGAAGGERIVELCPGGGGPVAFGIDAGPGAAASPSSLCCLQLSAKHSTAGSYRVWLFRL